MLDKLAHEEFRQWIEERQRNPLLRELSNLRNRYFEQEITAAEFRQALIDLRKAGKLTPSATQLFIKNWIEEGPTSRG